MSDQFRHYDTFRVRFSEVDAQAIVFNSRYLEYADNAITEFMRAKGIPATGPDGFDINVVQANVQYRRPLRFDDVVSSWVKVSKIGRSSMVIDIEFRRGEGDAEALHASVTLTYVHVDMTSGRPREISAAIRERLLA